MHTFLNKILKSLPVIPLLGVLIMVLPCGATALERSDVTSTFSSTYKVDENNTASTRVSIVFRNVGSNPTILTSYDLNLGNVNPQDVNVKHGDQNLSFELVESGGFVVRILIGDVLLRPDNDYGVEVEYKLPGFFTEVAGINSVVLPVFRVDEKSGSDYIEVIIPDSYGPVSYSSVAGDKSIEEDEMKVIFSDVGSADHLFLSVGSDSYYTLNIEKELINDSDTFVSKELMLPPDLSSQVIVLSSVSPYPDRVYKNDEGNFIFNYNVPPGETVWARIRGSIIERVPTISNYYLTPPERSVSLNTDVEWWKIRDDEILKDLDKFDSNLDDEDKAMLAYGYVIDNLNLSADFRSLHGPENRKGAETALKTYKYASAEDFADSFVGLARELGIPSRVVVGYIFPYSETGNSVGMFHVWPQYWLSSRGWISVDPAYEKYTGYENFGAVGLNRVVLFVVESDISENIVAETTNQMFPTNEKVYADSLMQVEVDVDDTFASGVKNEGMFVIRNAGNTVLSDLRWITKDSDLDVKIDEDEGVYILPGEEREIKFEAKTDEWYATGKRYLKVDFSAQSPTETLRESVSEEVHLTTIWWAEPLSWIATVLAFAIVSLGIYGIIKGAFVLAPKMKNIIDKIRKK